MRFIKFLKGLKTVIEIIWFLSVHGEELVPKEIKPTSKTGTPAAANWINL